MKRPFLVFTFAALLSGESPAFGAGTDQVGVVKSLAGSVSIMRSGGELRASPNERLFPGDVVQTGSNGKAGLVLEDDTLISLGPRSRIAIEDFVFRPEEKKLSLVMRIFHGTVSFISGRIARLAPDLVHIMIPHGTVGVRGTHLLIRVD